MAITVANLIQQLENSYSRSWVAKTTFYDGGWLVRKTPDSPFKRLNNVTPLSKEDDYDMGQRMLSYCGRHLPDPLAMRLIPLSSSSILNYVRSYHWKVLNSVGVFILNLQGRDVFLSYEAYTPCELNLFAETVNMGDIIIEVVDAKLYSEISILHHQASIQEVEPLYQLIQRCNAKAYPLIFKNNGIIFANIFLVEDNGMIAMFDYALAPNMRGQGLGQKSFNAILNYLQFYADIRFIWLQIENTNAAALHLYQSFGFKKIYDYHYYMSQ